MRANFVRGLETREGKGSRVVRTKEARANDNAASHGGKYHRKRKQQEEASRGLEIMQPKKSTGGKTHRKRTS